MSEGDYSTLDSRNNMYLIADVEETHDFGGCFSQGPTRGGQAFAGSDTGGGHLQKVRGVQHGPPRR